MHSAHRTCRIVGVASVLFLTLPACFAQATGATRQQARRPASACPTLPQEMHTARTLDLPCYTLAGYSTISGPVTIEPGVLIVASQGSAINVKDDGSLSAVGTAEKPIVFRGKDKLAGTWQGISFSNASAKNRLSYVHVEDAGKDNGSSSGAVFIFGAAAIDHSVITNSATIGLQVDYYGRLLDFTANRLEKNDVPIAIPAEALGRIDGATEFVENRQQSVSVRRSEVTTPATWHALPVPVAFELGPQLTAAVTIEPGLTMTVGNNGAVYVQKGGSLHAAGTAEKPIVFTGRGGIAGAWSGINIDAPASTNLLEYVHVDYAGATDWRASIVVGQDGYVAIRHTQIAHSQLAGLLIKLPGRTEPSGAALEQANSFVDCGGGHVVLER